MAISLNIAKVKTALEKNEWRQGGDRIGVNKKAPTTKICKCLNLLDGPPGTRTPNLLIKSEEKE
jgi:hypothetical protein